MALSYDIKNNGTVKIWCGGGDKDISLSEELILLIADEIRSRYSVKKPKIPQPQPSRREIFKRIPDAPKPNGPINAEVNPRGKIVDFLYRVFA